MRYRLRTLLAGQFGLFALFVLITLAAIAFAIIRLPVPVYWKFFLLAVLWILFKLWAGKNPDPRPAAARAHRIRLATLDAAGTILSFAPFIWLLCVELGPRPFSYADVGFAALIVAVTVRAVWQVIKANQQERGSANNGA